ncbi:keratin, type II cytoskeletal 80 isoform X2 [Pelodiscus sinensis]|uniref:keratin, type II cytoskeletal 80 isoform X2 n=1 Tax=Pelodiscus sinensis TaxID=13735 RepID=UPI003F6BE5EB
MHRAEQVFARQEPSGDIKPIASSTGAASLPRQQTASSVRLPLARMASELSIRGGISYPAWQPAWQTSSVGSVVTASDRGGSCSPGGPADGSVHSCSLGRCPSPAPPSVSTSARLLAPLHVDMDPTLPQRKKQEKEELQTLNNEFAALIGKVQRLEQQNQILTTQWSLLQDQGQNQACSEADTKLFYDRYMSKLQQEMRAIHQERDQLEAELAEVLTSMESGRSRYEDEIQKRSGLEFTFMELKKDLDASTIHRIELEVKLNGLREVLELKKTIREQEHQALLSEIQDISVVLGIDNRCDLDLSHLVEEVRAQYEALALRSWEDAEAQTWSKLADGAPPSTAAYREHLFSSRREMAELNIHIQKLRSSIVSLESQCLHLEENIRDAGESGQLALQDARAKVAELEGALRKGKAAMARLAKEHQDLLSIKLALDVEILTYRKLVEGEESSLESQTPTVVSTICSRPRPVSSISRCLGPSKAFSQARGLSTEGVSRNGAGEDATHSRSQGASPAGQEAEFQPGGSLQANGDPPRAESLLVD